jgi:hypothetical protein
VCFFVADVEPLAQAGLTCRSVVEQGDAGPAQNVGGLTAALAVLEKEGAALADDPKIRKLWSHNHRDGTRGHTNEAHSPCSL